MNFPSGPNPQLPPIDFRRLREFTKLTLHIRQFFQQQNFLEATTPSLVPCPGTEPYLDVFSTELRWQGKRQPLYLPTSPEISLKKLICLGSGSIFEIKNVFRNNELGQLHEPEFLMLEWYRVPGKLKDIQEDLMALIRSLLNEQSPAFQEKSMRELFRDYLDFNLTPSTSKAELLALAESLHLSCDPQDSIEDIFNLLFVDQIEAKFPKNEALFVVDYPPFQAAYAQLKQSGWADRFELYWQGLEIANAFAELTNAEEQLARMQADNQKKLKIGKPPVPIDEEFVSLMKKGLPECSGVALGVERLFMAMHGLRDIRILKPLSPTRN